jgi:hypothetical protein
VRTAPRLWRIALPKLLYSSEMVGCGAALELDSKETCLISVARRAGVRVRGSEGRSGRFWIGFFGSILYEERNAYKIAQVVSTLNSLFSERMLPIKFRNPALAAFANAVWHCSSAAEVVWKLNEAAAPAVALPAKSSAELLGALCELMERHPTSVLDASRLPESKQKMKAVMREVWQREPKLRDLLAQMYLYLSHFQDGIGDLVLDCKLPSSLAVAAAAHDLEALKQEPIEMTGPRGEDFLQRLMWEKVSLSEMEILNREWAEFIREHDPSGKT